MRADRLDALTGDANIEIVINNMRNTVALKKKIDGKTKLFIRFLMCEENEDELKDFCRLAKDMGIPLEVRKTHNYSGVIEDNFTSTFTMENRYPCYHLWFSPAITWEGKILLCCNDWGNFEVLGDINKESLASIWQGNRLKELRKFHLEGHYNKIPLCEKCNVWTLYPDIFFKFQKR